MGSDPALHQGRESLAQADHCASETAASSGMFHGALERRHCLVHANAFYEWRAMPDGKQPYAIGRKDGAPLAFVDVWEGWCGPDGETVRSFAILTKAESATMETLHGRMLVILGEEHWQVWLGGRAGEPVGLTGPADNGLLHLWAVSRAINCARNNSPDLLNRIDDPHATSPNDAPPINNPA